MSYTTIEAGPGCGKTYTLINASIYNRACMPEWIQGTEEQKTIWAYVKESLPRNNVIYLSYNRSSADDLKKRLPPNIDANTFHGAGAGVLKTRFGFQKLNNLRGQNIVRDLTAKPFKMLQGKDRYFWTAALRYVEKFKEELLPISYDNMTYLWNKYPELAPFKPNHDFIDPIHKLIQKMKIVDGYVEFVDQVWMALWCLNAPIYEVGYVDECQDVSPLRLAFAKALCKHLVFCGDANQAINAFAGADPYAFQKILDLSETKFPLYESFRLPPNIVQRVDRIRHTTLRSSPGKQAGIEDRFAVNTFVDMAKKLYSTQDLSTCLAVSRTNRNLSRMCSILLKQGIPAYIKDSSTNSTAEQLLRLIENRRADDLESLLVKLDEYYERLEEQGVAKGMLLFVEDQVNTVSELANDCKNIEELITKIKTLYTINKAGDCLMLTTIHKAKGMEAKNVFILYPPIPHPYGMETEVGREQEINLQYVAESRPIENLFEVVTEEK